MPWDVKLGPVAGLLAAICWLLPTLGAGQAVDLAQSVGPTDINVHRVLLYRNGDVEDSDLARSRRNVLVWLPSTHTSFEQPAA